MPLAASRLSRRRRRSSAGSAAGRGFLAEQLLSARNPAQAAHSLIPLHVGLCRRGTRLDRCPRGAVCLAALLSRDRQIGLGAEGYFDEGATWRSDLRQAPQTRGGCHMQATHGFAALSRSRTRLIGCLMAITLALAALVLALASPARAAEPPLKTYLALGDS